MKGKSFTVLVAIVLIFALGIEVGLSKEKEPVQLDVTRIMRKLEEVLANQTEILKQFDAIKQELAVIKVRASR